MSQSQTPDTTSESAYWCFISYRHADDHAQDRDWARWLHREIERYDVPAELVGTRNKRGDVIPERIYPVFRDEDSLPADADLARGIVQALDRSRFLVVLCSPRAVESRYVTEEVLHFKQAGKEDRIVAAILDGEPGDVQRECFPTPLRHSVGENGRLDITSKAEPIAADFRLPDGSQGYTSAEAYRLTLDKDGTLNKKQVKAQADAYGLHLQLMKLKIIAGVLGVPLEQLRNRDKAYQQELARRRARALRRWWAVIGFLTILGFAAVVVGYQERIRKQIQEFRAINQTLETTLELVPRFWNEGNVPQAIAGLFRAAVIAQTAKDHPRATNKERELAELLRRQLDLVRHGWRVLVEPEGVRDYCWSADGTRMATLSEQGRLRLWNAASGRPIAQASTRLGDAKKIRVANSGTRVFAAGDRAVQEATPLYIWRWDPEHDKVEEVYMQGGTDEGEGAKLKLFEMNPGGDLFVLDYLGLIYLKRDASGQLEEVQIGGDAVEEVSFDPSRNYWLGRKQNSFVKIDATNGQMIEIWNGTKGIDEQVQSRLLNASGKHYAFSFQMNGRVKVRWKELADGGAAGEFILKQPKQEWPADRPDLDFEIAMLSMNGATLAIPIQGGANERVELYDTSSGSLVSIFRLPSGRKYDRLRFSPASYSLAAPASYGVDLWTPFFYGPATESEKGAGLTGLAMEPDGKAITLELAGKQRTLEVNQLREPADVQQVLAISSALRWPDENHLLAGFSDLKIGYYKIEPFQNLGIWSHHIDPASLMTRQNYIRRTEDSDLYIAASPDGRHFISWSEYGGAQIQDSWSTESKPIVIGSLGDIQEILYRNDGKVIYALHDQEAGELSVFSIEESPILLRRFPVGFKAHIWRTEPDCGIAVVVDKQPNLIIDPNTGMPVASYFLSSKGEALAFRVVDQSLLQRIDGNEGGGSDSMLDERQTGYRWRSDMTAPIRLSWDELEEIWREEKR